MKTFSQTVEIAAEPERVWRALSDPAEVVCWDADIVEPLDAPPDYPRAGQHVRWRYRLGPFSLILHDRPTQVEAPQLLRSTLRLGPFDFDETYTLRGQGPGSTLLSEELSVASAIPFIGVALERVVCQSIAQSSVVTALAAIKRHCESS